MRCSACSGPTAPARPPRWRSSRGAAGRRARRVLGMDPASRPAALRQRVGIVLQERAVPPRHRREAVRHWARLYPPRATSTRSSSSRAASAAGTRARCRAASAPARLRPGARRRPRARVPRRAHHRLRPGGAPRRGTPSARWPSWQDRPAHHALPRRGQALSDRVAIVKDGRSSRTAPRRARRRRPPLPRRVARRRRRRRRCARPTTPRRCCTASPLARAGAASGSRT